MEANCDSLLALYIKGKESFTLSQQVDSDDDENSSSNGSRSSQECSSNIENFLSKLDNDGIQTLLTDAVNTGRLPDILAAIFSGSPIEKKDGSYRRQVVYLSTVNLLDRGVVAGKVAENCLIALLSNLDRLKLNTYEKLINAALDGISSEFDGTGVSFELVSEILTRVIAIKSGNGGGTSRQSFSNSENSAQNDGSGSSSGSGSSGLQSYDSSFKADEYQETVIRRICRTRWNVLAVTNVVKGLRGFNLAPNQIVRVVRKILNQFNSIPLNDLPPLVNQLLLLASKGEQAMIISGLADHFDMLDSTITSSEIHTLRAVEGTVLLHFNFAIKQDQRLAKTLLSEFGSGTKKLSPFRIGMMLSMHQIQRFSAQAIQAVVRTTKREFEMKQRENRSEWIGVMGEQSRRRMKSTPKKKGKKPSEAKVVEDEYDDNDEGGVTAMEIDEEEENEPEEEGNEHILSNTTSSARALHSVINNTSIGWENIIPSALHVCITLIETSSSTFGRPASSVVACSIDGAKTRNNSSHDNLMLEDPMTHKNSLPEAQCNRLGISLLSEAFLRQSAVRPQVLDTISMALAIKSPSTNNFIQLLHSICRRAPQLVLEYTRVLKDTLECMSHLEPHQAASLMRAVQPLLVARRSLLDAAVVVFRKSTFSRDASCRKVAVSGFLQLLGIKQNGESGSRQLYFDALGSLRRCLSQDETVRKNVYEGAVTICYQCSSSRPYVIELLSRQLQRVVQINETPPIEINQCVKRHEPVGHLIMSLHRCVWSHMCRSEKVTSADSSISSSSSSTTSSSSSASEIDGYVQKVTFLFSKLVKKIGATHPEDYDLESTTDYSGNNQASMHLRQCAVSLLRSIDALLDWSFQIMDLKIRDQGNVEEEELVSVDSIRKLLLFRRTLLADAGAAFIPIKKNEFPAEKGGKKNPVGGKKSSSSTSSSSSSKVGKKRKANVSKKSSPGKKKSSFQQKMILPSHTFSPKGCLSALKLLSSSGNDIATLYDRDGEEQIFDKLRLLIINSLVLHLSYAKRSISKNISHYGINIVSKAWKGPGGTTFNEMLSISQSSGCSLISEMDTLMTLKGNIQDKRDEYTNEDKHTEKSQKNIYTNMIYECEKCISQCLLGYSECIMLTHYDATKKSIIPLLLGSFPNSQRSIQQSLKVGTKKLQTFLFNTLKRQDLSKNYLYM
jgi:hypothetical protein